MINASDLFDRGRQRSSHRVVRLLVCVAALIALGGLASCGSDGSATSNPIENAAAATADIETPDPETLAEPSTPADEQPDIDDDQPAADDQDDADDDQPEAHDEQPDIDDDQPEVVEADHDDDQDDAADDHGDADHDDDHDHDEPGTERNQIDFLGSYSLIDDGFGTEVTVTVDGDVRTIESNSLPNHATGDFPNSGNPNAISPQELSYTFPVEPTLTGRASFAQTAGVSLIGVPMEPGTGESAVCDSGENYRIEALQETFDLGFDMNNAHVQPTGKYHYHGISELLVGWLADAGDLVHVGFAADGHLMYYSQSGAYSASYALSDAPRTGSNCDYRGTTIAIDGSIPDGTYVSDWQYIAGLGDLDECNGIEIDGQYVYVLTDEYPFISRCLMGEAAQSGPGGGPPPGGGNGGPPQGGGNGGPPQGGGTAPAEGTADQ